MISLCPRFMVLISGKISFVARFTDPYEALDACIRAEAAGYKAKMMRIPT